MPAMVIIRKCFNPDDVWCTVTGAFAVGKGSSLFHAVTFVVEERSISSTSRALGSGILPREEEMDSLNGREKGDTAP